MRVKNCIPFYRIRGVLRDQICLGELAPVFSTYYHYAPTVPQFPGYATAVVQMRENHQSLDCWLAGQVSQYGRIPVVRTLHVCAAHSLSGYLYVPCSPARVCLSGWRLPFRALPAMTNTLTDADSVSLCSITYRTKSISSVTVGRGFCPKGGGLRQDRRGYQKTWFGSPQCTKRQLTDTEA